jgi:cephalosporin-C deacetylase-like acetyl esterase
MTMPSRVGIFSFVAVVILAVQPFTVAAQELDKANLRVLEDNERGLAPKQLLRAYLLGQLHKHSEARRHEVAKLKSAEEFEARRQRMRETLTRINGPLPEKTPLNGQVVGTISRDGYTIEKVIYDSRPHHRITANLYLPADLSKPVPGVLVSCGHSGSGKADRGYQSACISLAKRGMAALLFDPIDQGERYQNIDASGRVHEGSTTGHTLLAIGGWLVGTGTANNRIWDGMRGIDYLLSRPEIDPQRIGCTGNSGGGTMTAYLMAFDDRIGPAATSCYITSFPRLFSTIGPQDGEQNFPGQVALGLDHADFITLRAPKPTLICTATNDFFDIEGAWATFRECKLLFGLMGHADRVDLFEYRDEHGFTQPRREAAMQFMRRQLLGLDDHLPEGPLTLSAEPELLCTKSGQVLKEFDDELSAYDLNRQRLQSLIAARAEKKFESPEELIAEAKRLTGFRERDQPAKVTQHGQIECRQETDGWNGKIEKLLLQYPDEMVLPALLFIPDAAIGQASPAVLVADEDGKADGLGEGERLRELLMAGKIVLSIDVRGCGETTADPKRGSYLNFAPDFEPAMLSLQLNHSLLGQRAEDMATALNYLLTRPEVDPQRVELVATGKCGPAGLHAAAFDTRFASVTLIHSLPSWQAVIDGPPGHQALVNIVPFALQSYDLPDLEQSLGERLKKVAMPTPE